VLNLVTPAELLELGPGSRDQRGQFDVRAGMAECRKHGGLRDVTQANHRKAQWRR